MKSKLLIVLKYGLGLGVGIGLLYLAFRDIDMEELSKNLASANYLWVLAAIFFALASNFFRAWRWKQLIEASGYQADIWNTYAAVMITYIVNLAIPRGGEVARCTALYKSDRVPVSVSFGTVFTERVFDVIILLGLILVFLLFESDKLWGFFVEKMDGLKQLFSGNASFILVAIGFLALAALVLLFMYRKKLEKLPLFEKILLFLRQMFSAALSIRNLKSPGLFLFSTLLIWVCYAFMTWLPLLALQETENMGIYFSLILLTMGGIGMMIPSPGGIGTYEYAIQFTFKAFYGASLGLAAAETLGITMAVITHSSQIIMILVGGFIAWMFLVFRPSNSQAVDAKFAEKAEQPENP